MPGRRSAQSVASRKGRRGSAGSGSASEITAVGRPSRASRSRMSATRAVRCGQSVALAQPPSITISTGPSPRSRLSGFNTGSAKARIAAASASILSASSHQGVRSGIRSGSCRPSSRATPGKMRCAGAGGIARSSHHSTGSAASAASSQGLRNESAPSETIQVCPPMAM